MIRKIRSKLSVKVFIITSLLMIACCSMTYWCIAYFSPYIYSHDISEGEEIAYQLSLILAECDPVEAHYFIEGESEKLADFCDDEFIFHIFKSSGEEVALPYLDTLTGKRITDFHRQDTSEWYSIPLIDGTEEYTLFTSKNTDKESQIVAALQKTLPVLSVVIVAISLIAAFFYTWYMTKPIKKVSSISRQMANMDFSGLCPVSRTDEIGVLSSSLNELSERLSAALSELQEANQKLQADIDMERRLDRQRLEFFSAASHELKTPITIIKGQLQGMLYQVGRYKDRETYLSQSIEVTETLEKMVQELLTISRLDTPGYTCKKCTFDFGQFINDRLVSYADLFTQRELTVEKEISSEICILGDTQLLQKVVDNLLSNAAAYSPAGNHVIVKLWKEAETVRFTIENTGVHIPDEDIPKLFEAFYRVEQSRNRQTGGSGLGLYIVKTVLDLHEAKIEIANTLEGVITSVQF